ncbi:hypothetical protein Tco_0608453 [Tanacetum coccineum]
MPSQAIGHLGIAKVSDNDVTLKLRWLLEEIRVRRGFDVSYITGYGVFIDAIRRIGSLESLSALHSTGSQPSSRLIGIDLRQITSSSLTLSVIFLLNTSIIARAVTKNGLPKIIGTLESSGISKTTKSIKMMNISTFMRTISIIPLGYWIVLSASSKLILVAFG